MKTSTWVIGGIALFVVAVSAFLLIQRLRSHERWAVYYHGSLPYEDFIAYDVVAFDSDIYPDFTGKKPEKQVILGYLSTSEAAEYRSYFKDMEQMGVLIAPSQQWSAPHAIDIRKPEWQDYFVHTLVPYVLAKGFDGIMIDTIDTALYLEEIEPQRFAGMKAAAIRLIKDIRLHHPNAKLMLNRGFAILPDVAADIDYALAESIYIQYTPATHSATYVPQAIYDELAGVLEDAQNLNPDLKVMTLDYVPVVEDAIPMVKDIYKHQRRNGFIPYVTTFDLGTRHEEPL